MKSKTPANNPAPRTPARLSKARLAEMIEEATVDAHDESEQSLGWFTMFEEHLDLPFETQVLGATVTVTRLDLRDDDQITAICTPGRERQAISLVDLPLHHQDRTAASGSKCTVTGAERGERHGPARSCRRRWLRRAAFRSGDRDRAELPRSSRSPLRRPCR